MYATSLKTTSKCLNLCYTHRRNVLESSKCLHWQAKLRAIRATRNSNLSRWPASAMRTAYIQREIQAPVCLSQSRDASILIEKGKNEYWYRSKFHKTRWATFNKMSIDIVSFDTFYIKCNQSSQTILYWATFVIQPTLKVQHCFRFQK